MRKVYITYVMALAVIVTAICTVQSCKKPKEIQKFDLKLKLNAVNVYIPITAYTNSNVAFGPVTNSYDIDSFIKAQTKTPLGVGNITSVKITACIINVDNADTLHENNFRDFQSCFADISTDITTDPYRLALNNIPDVYTTSLSMPVDSNVELKSYLRTLFKYTGTTFKYTVNAKFRRSINADMHCTIQYTFKVSVEG